MLPRVARPAPLASARESALPIHTQANDLGQQAQAIFFIFSPLRRSQ